jgi:replicative DNA helicase
MEEIKVPPHNFEAEEALISYLIQHKATDEVFDLSPEDFYRAKHKILFSVIKNLYNQKKPIDLVTVTEALRVSGALDEVGGVAGVMSIIVDIPITINPESSVKIIKSASIARSFYAMSLEFAKKAFGLTADNMAETFDLAKKKMEAIVSPAKIKKRVSIENVYTPDMMIESYQGYIRSLKNNRFLTGFDEIDKRIRGVSGGEVLTIIARPGCFKTAMLQNMLLKYTNSSAWNSVFFSLEMPISSVTERFMGITMGFENGEAEDFFLKHEKKELDDGYYDEIKTGFKLRMQKVFTVPTKVSLADVREYIHLIESKKNVKVGVIGIDYLGLISSPGKNEYEVVSEIARGAKDLAKELNLPVVLLCQTSRSGADGEQEISLDMGRGSGAIEEAADFILGLWRQEVKDGMGAPTGEYDLLCRILKNRKGPHGSRWRLGLQASNLQFSGNAEEVKTQDAPKKKWAKKKSTEKTV